MAIRQVCRSRGVGQYLASERHIIWWHRIDPLTPGAKIGMMLAHGFAGTADYFITDPISGLIAPTLVSANQMPVIATDVAGLVSWGNSSAVTAMDATMTFFQSRAGANAQVILLGQSMGAATVLNWARTNMSNVAAIALHVPAVDLQDFVDNDRAGLGASVAAAYGLTYPDTPPPTVPSDFNPALNTATFATKPIRIWYSADDPVCIPGAVTAFGTATSAEMTNLGPVGHSITGIDLDDMAAWAAQFI